MQVSDLWTAQALQDTNQFQLIGIRLFERGSCLSGSGRDGNGSWSHDLSPQCMFVCVCARVLLRIAPAMPSIRPPNVKKVKGCQLWRYVKILGGMTSTHLGWFIDIYSDVMICHAPHPNRKMMWRAPSSSLILYVQCFLLAQLSYGESFSWRKD